MYSVKNTVNERNKTKLCERLFLESVIAKCRGHPRSVDEWADGWENVEDARFSPQMPGFLIRYLTEAFLFHSSTN